jgi:DNA-binding protein HU-beta
MSCQLNAPARYVGGDGLSFLLRCEYQIGEPGAGHALRSITLNQLAASLAEEHELTKRAGRELLDNLVSLITKHLKKGERIRIAGLGILQVRKRPARMGRNPATGEAIKIGASKKVAFRASKELKEAI